MNQKGYSVVELLVVIAALGVATIVILSTTSNAFKDETNDLYEEKTRLIEREAEKYGATLNNLKEQGNLVILVDDVVKAGYYVPDTSDGKVVDPRNKNNNLNGLKIKLTYNEDKITASIIDDD